MSVIVKGMEIPKNCYACMTSGFRSAIKCEEWSSISAGLFGKMRSPSCPLVELPEKHGELIDKDEFLEMLIRPDISFSFFSDGMFIDVTDVCATILNTPTVLEAEGSDDR